MPGWWATPEKVPESALSVAKGTLCAGAAQLPDRVRALRTVNRFADTAAHGNAIVHNVHAEIRRTVAGRPLADGHLECSQAMRGQ